VYIHNNKEFFMVFRRLYHVLWVMPVIALAIVAEEAPKMFLCADSLQISGNKQVYGYIDGKKTGCMSEYEFLAAYNQTLFARDSVSRAAIEKEAMEQAKAGKKPIPADSLALQILNGKKDLDGADLMGINLEGANLKDASMVSADMRQAKLGRADMTNANLEAAFLRRADLRGTNLSGANLKSAYLGEADLRGAKGLTVESLKNAATLYKAKFDNALTVEIKAEAPEKLKEPSKCWENNQWTDNDDCTPEKGLANPAQVK
jgi:hypothetical protein